MITTLPPKPARPATLNASTPASLAPNYRLLGLRPREARVEVIRDAVHQAASQVQLDAAATSLTQPDSQAAETQVESEQRLAEIAIAGYRLLDPRRRRTLFERVQLLMWSEEELDVTLKSMWALDPGKPAKPPRVKIAIRRASAPAPQSSSDAADENQVALELFRSMRQRDRRALALWVGVATLTVSLAGALALFAWLS